MTDWSIETTLRTTQPLRPGQMTALLRRWAHEVGAHEMLVALGSEVRVVITIRSPTDSAGMIAGKMEEEASQLGLEVLNVEAEPMGGQRH